MEAIDFHITQADLVGPFILFSCEDNLGFWDNVEQRSNEQGEDVLPSLGSSIGRLSASGIRWLCAVSH